MFDLPDLPIGPYFDYESFDIGDPIFNHGSEAPNVNPSRVDSVASYPIFS
jgi:hypothetical protein